MSPEYNHREATMTHGTLEERARQGIEIAPAALEKMLKNPPVLHGNSSGAVAVVKSRWEEIVVLRNKGFSAYAIARQLTAAGVPFKADVLRKAIRRLETDGLPAKGDSARRDRPALKPVKPTPQPPPSKQGTDLFARTARRP